MEELHQIQPRLDRGTVHQRRTDIAAKRASACAGHGAVHGVEQRALALAAGGAGELQAVARRGVDRHCPRRLDQHGRAEEGERTLGGVVEIGDEPAGGGERGAAELAEAIQRGDAEQTLQPRFTACAVEIRPGAQAGGGMGVIARFAGDRLGRRKAGKLGADRIGAGVDHQEAAGGDVGCGQRDLAARFTDGDAPIVGAGIQQRLLGQRAGGDDANDAARDQCL